MTTAISDFGAADKAPAAGDPALAARAVNELGLDLLAKGTQAGANALLSPYSIQSALAMTYAGSAGDTMTEMARVLHYPADETALQSSFAALRTRLLAQTTASEERVQRMRKFAPTAEPLTLTIANRLFGQDGYEFRQPFLEVTKAVYGAPFQTMDFKANPEAARTAINAWIDQQTKQRIRDLIPAGALTRDSRLVLVNAIYLKAAWAQAFQERATKPEAFHVNGGNPVELPTMQQKARFGYRHEESYSVVTLPYVGGDLRFVVVLPDAVDGLPAVEEKMTAGRLASFASLPTVEIILHLPKFKMQPPVMRLGETLELLGMKAAFDQPRGSANFDRMAPRRPDDYLYISDVFHKTFLDLDEKGTEAAAATAVSMVVANAVRLNPPQPIEVRVDHPFLFAIQDRSTGACLFLGRMVDPR